MAQGNGSGEALEWGKGQRLLEIFLEPTCPHCGRAFDKLMPLLERAGPDRLTVRIWLQSQPWHLFSAVVSRAILAATLTEGGKAAALQVFGRVFEHRAEFIAEDHCKGANMKVSPAEMIARIERLTGLALTMAFEAPQVTALIKRHARFARQNGIHVSPTIMVDGLVNDAMGSRDDLDKWMQDIGLG